MRKSSRLQQIVIGSVVVVGVLGSLMLAFPWSLVFLLQLLDGPGSIWTDCAKTLRGTVTSADAGLEAKLFHIQCPPPFAGFEPGAIWFDFFALTFAKPGTDPSRYETAMSASFGYGEDNSAFASWTPDMAWKGPGQFHIALPSSFEVRIREPSFVAWERSGRLKVAIPNVTDLEIERLPN